MRIRRIAVLHQVGLLEVVGRLGGGHAIWAVVGGILIAESQRELCHETLKQQNLCMIVAQLLILPIINSIYILCDL